MNFSDPITRAKKHLAEITGGEWAATGFTVKSRTGALIGHMQRATDAEFLSEAPVILSMLLTRVSELQAEAKKARYEVSADRDQVTTLKDQLANARQRRDELQIQLDTAWAELEKQGKRR